MADHRPDVYLEESLVDGVAVERLIFRASTLNGCTRALVSAGRGLPPKSPPEWLLERFDEGAAAEDEILDAFCAGEAVPSPRNAIAMEDTRWALLSPEALDSYRDLGYVRPGSTHDGQFTAEVPVGDMALIRGHLDGIARVYQRPTGGGVEMGQRVVLEAKDLGPDYFRDWTKRGLEAFPNYAMQLSIYMHATGLPGVFLVGEKQVEEVNGERVVSRNRVEYEWFDTPPIGLGAIKARVAKLVPLVLSDGEVECSHRQFPCPFFWLEGSACNGGGAEEELVTLDGDEAAELAVAVEQYRRGQEQEAAGKKLKKEWGPKVCAGVEAAVGKGGKLRLRGLSTADVTPEGDDGEGGFLVITDHVQHNEARVVEYKAGEVRYPKIKIEKKSNKGDG